jgi:hypothetical protein
VQNRPWLLRPFNLRGEDPFERRFFFFFCLENISIFYLPVLNSLAKKLFLGRKILEGHPQTLHPQSYYYVHHPVSQIP